MLTNLRKDTGAVLRSFILPLEIISESVIQPFKFWLDGNLWDGLHFRNEFYYRLKEQPIAAWGMLQRFANGLMHDGADVLLSVDDRQCSLWVNLRKQCTAPYTEE